jgi:hypothetical protein
MRSKYLNYGMSRRSVVINVFPKLQQICQSMQCTCLRIATIHNSIIVSLHYNYISTVRGLAWMSLSVSGQVEVPNSQRISCLDSSLGRVAACDRDMFVSVLS